MRMRVVVLMGACFAALGVAAAADYPIRNADFGKVRLTHGFWFDRAETNRTATLKSNWDKCAETPRLANFKNAAERKMGTFGGIPFDDSDVYKVMEGTAYVLAEHPDAGYMAKMDALIADIARAQEPDGYLYTARTLGYDKLNWGKKSGWHCGMMGPTRWSNLVSSHELYNVGHLYEAAVAWHRATGRDDLLTVAEKSAALIGRTFGTAPFQLRDVSGHEEIELALCKLYRETGKKEYLDLARHLIDQRGQAELKKNPGKVFDTDGKLVAGGEMSADGCYTQNHRPFALQREAVGHAVRAAYLYCGATDVAVLAGIKDYDAALDAIWNNIVGSKLHLTGGIGASPRGEAFGKPYELPNDCGVTYLETCAAIGFALWNDRLFRRTGESKYVDLLERTIHNGFVSGISLSGDEYFYPNPLAARAGYKRSKWFGCSCCPVNDVRVVPQVPSMAFAAKGGTVYWNLFMAGEAEIAGAKFAVETDYPWKGEMTLKVLAAPSDFTTLKVRIPGWAVGRPVPSDLYEQTEPSDFGDVLIEVNGLALNGCPGRDGYVDIGREWKAGDVVKVTLPMPVKRIRANAKVAADKGRLAVEKGPIVYCAEGFDNGGKAYRATLPADATFEETSVRFGDKTFPALKASNGLVLIPYCLWGNREPGNELQTWFAASREAACGNEQGIFTTASHCWCADTTDALFDGKVPASSADASIPRFTFWPQRGTEEWVGFELPSRRRVKEIKVYWFDDHHGGSGNCALPASWKVQSRPVPDQPWKDAAGATYTTVRDGFSVAAFAEPVEAAEFRIVVRGQPERSSGILEIVVPQ